jgi:hypothetical protein
MNRAWSRIQDTQVNRDWLAYGRQQLIFLHLFLDLFSFQIVKFDSSGEGQRQSAF